MKNKKTLILTALATFIGSINATKSYASCVHNYDVEIQYLKSKRLVFKPEKGANALVGIAETLGATAVGITAGGVVGFILPYAITGATAVVTAVPTIIAANAIGAAAINSSEDGFPPEEGDGAAMAVLATLVGGCVDAALQFGSLHLAQHATIAVASAVVPATMQFFVPITAVAGGLTGLTIGTRDAILNYKVRSLYKAKELIEYAYHFQKDERFRGQFFDQFKKLGRRLTSDMTLESASKLITNVDGVNGFCQNSTPLNFHQMKKAIKTEMAANAPSSVSLNNQILEEAVLNELASNIKKLNLVEKNTAKAGNLVLQITL